MLLTNTAREEATAPLPLPVCMRTQQEGSSCCGSSGLQDGWKTTSWSQQRKVSEADAGGTQRLTASVEAACSASLLIPRAAHCNASTLEAPPQRSASLPRHQRSGSIIRLRREPGRLHAAACLLLADKWPCVCLPTCLQHLCLHI